MTGESTPESALAFDMWALEQPPKIWSMYDLHGAKLGWNAGRSFVKAKVENILAKMEHATDEEWVAHADEWMLELKNL